MYIESPSVLNKGFSRNKEILSKLKLLGRSFDYIVPEHIIRYIAKMNGDLGSIELALTIMHDYKKKPEQMLKNLIFIHFVMQVHHHKFSNEMFEHLMQEISDLLEAAQLYLEKKREETKEEKMKSQKESKNLLRFLFLQPKNKRKNSEVFSQRNI